MAVTGEELTLTVSVPFCFLQRIHVVNIRKSKLVKLFYTFPQQETAATDVILSRQNFCRYKYLSRNVCHVSLSRQNFFAPSLLLSSMFVATKKACFVATKMILVAAPANDNSIRIIIIRGHDWTASCALCAMNSPFSRTTVFADGPHPVCPFGMAN